LNSEGGAVPGFGLAKTDRGGGFGQMSGDLVGHSPIIIRWTSPVTGTVKVSGAAFHPRTIGRSDLLILREKGESSAASERHVLGALTDSTPRSNPLLFTHDIDVSVGRSKLGQFVEKTFV